MFDLLQLFLWLSPTACLVAFAFGFLTTRSWLGFIGAAVAVPFCLAVYSYPMFRWAGPLALCTNFVAAYLLYRGRSDIAFACLVPFAVIFTILCVFAVRHITLVPDVTRQEEPLITTTIDFPVAVGAWRLPAC
jgi:hypothetical protein